MQTPILLAVAGLLALASIPAQSESTDCSNPTIVVPDGRLNESVFPAPPPGKTNTTYWYGFFGQSGHSYAIEFLSPADNDPIHNSTTVSFNTFQVWGPNDVLTSCNGNSSVNKVSTSAYSPVLMHNPGYGDGERFAFTAATPGLYLMTISNSGGTGNYTFRVVDTTLFNPRWSTWSGYDTQWGFANLCDMAITGTLIVYDSNGYLVTQVSFTLTASGQPGSYTLRNSSAGDLNIARNRNGYAVFSYNGPPQAIQADAYFINATATVIVPTKFESRNSQ